MTTPSHEGHRQRLRQTFADCSTTLNQCELLELLLTYAIPRRDVALLAQSLINRFGSINGVLSASMDELAQVEGIGDSAATLISLTGFLVKLTVDERLEAEDKPNPMAKKTSTTEQQPSLFALPADGEAQEAPVELHTYANDEVANALQFIPKAAEFDSFEAYKGFLVEKLPYNSVSTRQRRTNYILSRFYPDDRVDTPLTYFAARCSSADLKPVLFYHILKSEQMVAKVADEFVWAALPIGYIEREDLRRFILGLQPDLSQSSQKNILRSIFVTYDLLSLGQRTDDRLNLRTQVATNASFLYVLTSEFPQPGMHKFEDLEQGVMRRWLLWDREWIRQELYSLRDAGLIAKVSEIDNIRQFTLAEDQGTLLTRFFHKV